MRFMLYLSNWTTDRFEIRSAARLKVAVMILGLIMTLNGSNSQTIEV